MHENIFKVYMQFSSDPHFTNDKKLYQGLVGLQVKTSWSVKITLPPGKSNRLYGYYGLLPSIFSYVLKVSNPF